MATKLILGTVVAAAVIVGVLSFTPTSAFAFAGVTPTYRVAVTVSMTEVQAVFISYYQINGVSPSVAGVSPVIDWTVLGFAGPTSSATYVLTVTLDGPGHYSASATETKFLPTLPTNTNFGVTDTLSVGYVHSGSYSVHASLSVNGTDRADGSATVCVGC